MLPLATSKKRSGNIILRIRNFIQLRAIHPGRNKQGRTGCNAGIPTGFACILPCGNLNAE
jgi:hypothetical protein